MRKIFILIILLVCIKLHAEVILYADSITHLYFELNTETKEASVGIKSYTSNDIANALNFPPLSDPWWNSQQPNYWENIDVPEKILYKGLEYTVTSIAPNAFYETTRIKSIRLPNTIREFGDNAFYFCVNLEQINIPKELKTVGPYAFVLCRKLNNIELPNGLISIGSNAFKDCSGLTSINIPGTCISIGNDAFAWCTKLTDLIIEDGPTILNLGYNYEHSLDYEGQDTRQYRGQFSDSPIKTLYLGRNLSYPEYKNQTNPLNDKKYNPFYCITNYCVYSSGVQSRTGKKISSVSFGEYVTEISDELFYDCGFDNDIILPKNLVNIGNNAFYRAISQRNITLPATLKSIGERALTGLNRTDGITKIVCESPTPPSIINNSTSNSFNNNMVVIVPSNSGNLYRNTVGWSSHIIVDESDDFVTVNVKTPGTLYSRLLAQDVQLNNVFKLKLKGRINEDDWNVIKQMYKLYEYDLSEISNEEIPSFENNSKIYGFKFPSNIKQIPNNCFSNCFNLSGVIEIPSQCTHIGDRAFYNTQINEVIIPTELEAIGEYTFAYCKHIDTINIHYDIGNNAFANSGVHKIYVSNYAKIGNSAFYNCQNLIEVVIGSETILEDDVFARCENINKLTFEGNVTYIGKQSYNSQFDLYINNINKWCEISFIDLESHPAHVAKTIYVNGEIPLSIQLNDSITEIKKYTFYNQKSLQSITLPQNLHSIDNQSFFNCFKLENIVLPNSLYSIGESAFENCYNIKKIEFPIALKNIESNAFKNCCNLLTVEAPWGEPFSVTLGTFYGVSSDCCLFVPILSATKYLNSGWKFSNIKEVGNILITSNIGGTVKYNNNLIRNATQKFNFQAYKSFYLEIFPDDNCKIYKINTKEKSEILR